MFSSYNPASQVLAQSRDNNDYGYADLSIETINYAANGLSQHAAVGGDSPTHDDNGDLETDGAPNPTNCDYDVENRLISVAGGKSALPDYDPIGRLFGVSAGTSTRTFYMTATPSSPRGQVPAIRTLWNRLRVP